DDRSIGEVRRRILGTLTASYDFFALYARTEGWKPESVAPPLERRPAMDRWILSRVKACATSCSEGFENLEPARALRSLEQLIVDEVSNWYIRQNRRRFWNSEDSDSQLSAFATLHDVLSCLSRLIAPITPFLAEALHERLGYAETVHLMAYPSADGFRDLDLEQAMDPILRAASLGRSIRERVGIRVRQPLQKLVLHVSGAGSDLSAPMAHEESLKRELNVREIEWLDSTPDFLELKAKANFPRLGKRAGKHMKALAAAIGALSREEVFSLQGGGSIEISLGDEEFILEGEDVLVETLSVEGLEAAADGVVTLGLVTELDEDLLLEGLAREVVNRLQGLRKSTGLEISDRISVRAFGSERLHSAILAHADWIRKETLIEGELLWEENQGDSFELPGAETVVLAIASV
ncbi:MAG: DUF5915 domain-containing protein, partial [Planctomycetes bacterium]|nr:DUF5915 domain-containing protein [Planctomycetota bacterium]